MTIKELALIPITPILVSPNTLRLLADYVTAAQLVPLRDTLSESGEFFKPSKFARHNSQE